MANVWIWIKKPELLGGRLLSCIYLWLFLSQCWYCSQAAILKMPTLGTVPTTQWNLVVRHYWWGRYQDHQRNTTLDVAAVFLQWQPLCLAGITLCKSDNRSSASYDCKSKDNVILDSLTFPYSGLLSWKSVYLPTGKVSQCFSTIELSCTCWKPFSYSLCKKRGATDHSPPFWHSRQSEVKVAFSTSSSAHKKHHFICAGAELGKIVGKLFC